MKLLSTSLELRAIKSICSSKDKLAGMILSQLDETHFHYGPTKEALTRIKSLVLSSGRVPTYSEICNDPSIEEDSRKILSDNSQVRIKKEREVSSLLRGLDKYRKLRGLYFTAEEIFKSLKDSKIDVEDLLDETSNSISNARSRLELRKDIYHFGKNNNTASLIKKLLDGSPPKLIPTGFETFDSVNGGFFPGSLVVIASTSGGGKSTLGNQLLINMSLRGYDTVIVPLEMTEEETAARIMAERSGVNILNILRKKTSSGEKKLIKKAMRKYITTLKDMDSRYSIFSPEEDMTAEEILLLLKSYGYHVIIIDYINLLKGVGDEDSWRQLGNVARFCKTYARINDVVIILVAQLSDEGKVRYSRAVQEHANNLWVWNYTDESKETGLLDIRQPKARNQNPFSFQLAHDFPTMRIRDVKPGEENSLKSSKGEKKRESLDSFVEEIEMDSEEDEE